MKLLEECENILKNCTHANFNKQVLHHPVILITDKTTIQLEIDFTRTFSEHLKFPDTIFFLSFKQDLCIENDIDESYVILASQENSFETCGELDIHCLISVIEPESLNIIQQIMDYKNDRQLSVTIFWYLLINETTNDLRIKSKEIIEKIPQKIVDDSGKQLIKHSVFILNNALYNREILNPNREKRENCLAITNIILLTCIKSNAYTILRNRLIECKFKTLSTKALATPTGEITAATLHLILTQTSINNDISVIGAEEKLTKMLGIENDICRFIEEQINKLDFPNGDTLISIPHKKKAWKTLKNERTWNDNLLEELTLGCWEQYINQVKNEFLAEMNLNELISNFERDLLNNSELYFSVFAVGVTEDLLKTLEMIGDKKKFNSSQVFKDKLIKRLSDYFKNSIKIDLRNKMISVLKETLQKLSMSAQAAISTYKKYVTDLEQTDEYYNFKNASLYIDSVYNQRTINLENSLKININTLMNEYDNLLLNAFERVVTGNEVFKLHYDDELYNRLKTIDEKLDKESFLHSQLTSDINNYSRLYTVHSPSVIYNCYIGELTDEIIKDLTPNLTNPYFLKIDNYNSVNRIVIYELQTPIQYI